MKEYIKYIPLGLFVAFSVKMLMSGASLQDAPVFAILTGFAGYMINREEDKILNSLTGRLKKLEEQSTESKKEAEELRSHVSTIKLGQQIRSAVKF
jgi:uncharacterized protein YdaL